MDLVNSITIESAFTPPLVIDKPFQAGTPNWFLSFLKPKITVALIGGQTAVSKPYGEPVSYWGAVKTAGILFVVIFVFIFFFMGKRK
jgi:hypothetical protein